jgi:glycosyltransferase involved in cell wall biosynthesis
MKVLSIGSVPPAWGGSTSGGVATYQASLAEAAAKNSELDLTILPTNQTGRNFSELAPTIFRSPPSSVSDEKRYYENTVPGFDAVLFHHVHHRWMQYHIQSGRPRPCVGFIHSWHPITFAKDNTAMELARVKTQAGLQAADALVFPSRHTMKEGSSLGLSWNCPSFVVHHPLRETFKEAPERAVSERKQIAFVGELTSRKGPLQLLQAVAQMPKQVLTFLGEGYLTSDLQRLIAEWQLFGRVRLLGQVEPSVVREELNRSAVMCLPSCSESFGIVYIEALACGTPVVGFKPVLDEIEDAMGVNCGVGLPDAGVATLASALQTVITSSWNRDLLRSRALERFSGDGAVRMLVQAFVSAQRHHADRS